MNSPTASPTSLHLGALRLPKPHSWLELTNLALVWELQSTRPRPLIKACVAGPAALCLHSALTSTYGSSRCALCSLQDLQTINFSSSISLVVCCRATAHHPTPCAPLNMCYFHKVTTYHVKHMAFKLVPEVQERAGGSEAGR